MKKGFQPILDYVEGRMSITEFQFLFETDKSLQRMLNYHWIKRVYAISHIIIICLRFLKKIMNLRIKIGILYQKDRECKGY